MLDQSAVDSWLGDFVSRLRDAFADRLVFVGHHGSWARGEAGGESDIDTIVILDRIEPHDLATYRSVVHSMPGGGRDASGLVNSASEMRSRPRSELLQYFYGCQVLHGSLDGVVECPSAADLIEDARRKASNNLLTARHYLLYPHDLAQKVHGLHYPFKECVYTLQAWMLAQSGRFLPRKEDLLAELADADDRSVVAVARDWRETREDREARPRYYVELLERWSRQMLLRLGEVSHLCAVGIDRTSAKQLNDRYRAAKSRFTVGMFGIILDDQKRALLCHRRDHDLWNLPGGSLESGEPPWDGLRREVREETGLEVEVSRLAGVYSKPEQDEIVLSFVCKSVGGEITLNDEADKIGYFEISKLPPNTVPKQVERIKDAIAGQAGAILKMQTGKSSIELVKEGKL
jgi:ADP-ribose pyrophosphatase YjhB (NUDIX family)